MKHLTLTALALALGCASSSNTAATAQTTAPTTAAASASGAQSIMLPSSRTPSSISATTGASGAINLTFSGLAAGTKYLGSVAYSGASGMPNPTIVRVDTP